MPTKIEFDDKKRIKSVEIELSKQALDQVKGYLAQVAGGVTKFKKELEKDGVRINSVPMTKTDAEKLVKALSAKKEPTKRTMDYFLLESEARGDVAQVEMWTNSYIASYETAIDDLVKQATPAIEAKIKERFGAIEELTLKISALKKEIEGLKDEQK